MNTISENANPWRPSTELAVVPEARTSRSIVPEKGAPKAIGSEGNIEDEGFQVFGEDGFTFMDFLDIINPLQHIPIVATLYREMSGDDLDPGSRVIGDTLFMGPVGTVAALANVMIDDATGMDMGEHVMAFFDDGTSGPPEVSDNGTGPVAISPAPVGNTSAGNALAASATDPVTAWAMAEASYRKSAAEKMAATQAGGITASFQVQAPVPASVMASAPTPALSDTIDVANWAMAEASYRKSAAASSKTPSPASQPELSSVPAPRRKGATPYAEAPSKAPIRGINALAALRQDLKAGAVLQAARASEAKAAIAESRQGATTLAAANFNSARPVAKGRTASPATQRPAGAIAAEGGWFLDSMLSTLSKYDNGATLAGAALTRNDKPNSIDLAR